MQPRSVSLARRMSRWLVLSALAGAGAVVPSAFAAPANSPQAVVERLFAYRAEQGSVSPGQLGALGHLLSPGLIARCQRYQAALDAPGTPTDLVPSVNYDPLTGSQEALSANFVVSVLKRAPRSAHLRVRATYPDGQRWGDIPVQVVRLDGGQWRISNVGRLREDCTAGPYPQ